MGGRHRSVRAVRQQRPFSVPLLFIHLAWLPKQRCGTWLARQGWAVSNRVNNMVHVCMCNDPITTQLHCCLRSMLFTLHWCVLQRLCSCLRSISVSFLCCMTRRLHCCLGSLYP